MSTQEIYKMWVKANLVQGCEIESWDSLEENDKMIWHIFVNYLDKAAESYYGN